MTKTRTLLRIILGLGLGLVAVEGAAWSLDGGGFPHLNRFEPDPVLGLRLQPDTQTRITFRGNTTRVRINPQGYRGPDWGPSLEGEVLLVGDSQIFGLGVEEQHTHAAQLAALSGRTVLNAGVPTYGPNEYREVVRQQLLERPGITQVVVIYNYGNDLFELGNPNLDRHQEWDGWALRKETAPQGSWSFPGRRWLMSSSHAVYHLRRLMHDAPEQTLALPSEGSYEQVLAARLESKSSFEMQSLSDAERARSWISTQEKMAQSQTHIAQLIQQVQHPGQDPYERLQELAGPDLEAVGDIISPRFIEMARSPTTTASLLLTSAGQLQEAERTLGVWADQHPGHLADDIQRQLEERRRLQAKLDAEAALTGPARPRSAMWSELVALRTLCRESGATLTVVALPLDVQVDPAEWDKYGEPRQDLSATLTLLDALMEDAQALGIRGVNLLEPLRAAQPGALLDGDLHMTQKGNAAVAQALAAALDSPAPMTRPTPGVPEHRSRVPTWSELRRLPENTVKGSTRNHCVTHELREWLSVRCFPPVFSHGNQLSESRWYTAGEYSQGGWTGAPPSWTPRGVTLLDAPVETYIVSRPDQFVGFVMPLFPGRPADVDVHWSNRTERLEVRWQGDTPSFEFVDKRPASAPPERSDARNQIYDGATRPTPACEQTWPQDDWSYSRCIAGHRTHLPTCGPEQVNAGSGGQCAELCDSEHPCSKGECLPWLGAELCQ